MASCRRCDFRADDLTDHAFDSGHLLCICCHRRSLTEFQAQSCGDCIGSLRADLADIVQAYAELEPVTVEALTLLGFGTMQRHARKDELDSLHPARHPLAKDDEPTPPAIRDEWPNDPLPVVELLVSWEDFIREHYRDSKGQPEPTLSEVVDYLTVNLDSRHDIAQTFPAFDEFADTVRQLRSALQHAAGLVNDPLTASANCFDCGAPLIREYRGEPKLQDVTRQGLDFEGLADEWTCRACRRTYTPAEYVLAVRAVLEETG